MIKNSLIITKNIKVADRIYYAELEGDIGCDILPGQFVNLTVPGKFLPRPFGVLDYTESMLSICYAVVGEGTDILSRLAVGARLDAVYPLGNGFDTFDYTDILVAGGGLGLVPLYRLLKTKGVRVHAMLGFSSINTAACVDMFRKDAATLRLFTDDGSAGERGYMSDRIPDVISKEGIQAVYACGPRPMLSAIKRLKLSVPVYVSTEERMGCGVGACLVCACKTTEGNKRACTDGPVFNLDRLIL